MKLRIIRFSGRPVTPEALTAYDKEFKLKYDEITAKHGNDMLAIHAALIELDAALLKQFETVLMAPMPKSAKAWKTMLDTYEAPVMVAKSSENPDELVMLVMDQQLV